MIGLAWDAVDKTAIDGLLASKVPESKTLEYKQTLPGGSDADKKEFLADVSSFANASGGDIIYGIRAEVDSEGKTTGKPDGPAPITNASPDEVILRLEGIIRDGTDPRVKVQSKAVTGWNGDNQGFVLVIRVPRSFSSPHVVKYGDSSRFWSRNSAGKYRLDVDELRSAFLATDSQGERIRRFREDRLARIVADETPVRLAAPERLVLHVIPLQSFLSNERLDLSHADDLAARFQPLGASGEAHRYNLDGLLMWEKEYTEGRGSRSYCQLFFDGTIETVSAGFARQAQSEEYGRNRIISGAYWEKVVVDSVSSYLEGFKALGVLPPVVIMGSALGCRGAIVVNHNLWPGIGRIYPIDREALVLPDVSAESLDVECPQLLKPIFDSLWNASGFVGSPSYDAEGNWMPPR